MAIARTSPVFWQEYYIPDFVGTRKCLVRSSSAASPMLVMIRAGFLAPGSRQDLIDLARDGSAAHRLARRPNALMLPDHPAPEQNMKAHARCSNDFGYRFIRSD